MDKLLLRLIRSAYVDNFMLKGALLLRVFGLENSRTTKDIDFGTTYYIDPEVLKQIIAACLFETETDEVGLFFDKNSLRSENIREQQVYQGVRITFLAYLGSSKINMQIDIGFGDIIYPAPLLIEFPQVLDTETIHLYGYTLESAIAEKFHAMVVLDMVNSRMKDFYDVYFLSKAYAFELVNLRSAISATFIRRKTKLPISEPVALSHAFASEKQKYWSAYLRKSNDLSLSDSFEKVIEKISQFIWPAVQSIHLSSTDKSIWTFKDGWHKLHN